MQTIVSMFATFVAFVSGVIAITEAVNKLFKVENQSIKLLVSWLMSFGLAALGFYLQLGFFADCGPVDTWQGWVKAMSIGLGCGWCANKMYNREEMWRMLEWVFSFFNKDGKAIRARMEEERKQKKLVAENGTKK